MSDRNAIRLEYPNGYCIYAWIDDHEGSPHVKVQWRSPDGKPIHQPFYVEVGAAKDVFGMLAAFAASAAGIAQPAGG